MIAQCVDAAGAHYRVSVQIKGNISVPSFGPLARGPPRLVSAAALAPLVRLTWLNLEHTAVAGCGAFCGESGPFRTNCHPHPDPDHGCKCY